MSTVWNRYLTLYLDVDAPAGSVLLAGLTSSTLTQPPTWVQSDVFPLRLYFRRKSGLGAQSIAMSLTPTDAIVLAGKKSDAIDETELLFSATAFTAYTDDDGDPYYEALLNLHTDELNELFDAHDELTCRVDVEVQNAANTARSTLQFDVRIVQQVYAGEADPTPGTPPYPPPTSLLTKIGSSVAIPTGATYVTITADFGGTPAMVLLTVRKPSAGAANLWATLRSDTLSATGFTADLSAPAGINYALDYLAIL